jgi:uncharacterized coiled-coil protein SlyX
MNNMKEFIQKYQKAIVGTDAVSVLLICYFQQKEMVELRTKVKKQEVTIDSLNAEIFPIQIELGRYENAYQILLERNPKAAQQYGTIISDETE